MIPAAVRVGSLHPGDYFRTAGTERLGVVLGQLKSSRLMGVACGLEGPDEEKNLHPDVMVLPERA